MMSKSTHRSWVIILVLVMVSATAQMVSAGSQTWYLSSDYTTSNYTMYKGSQDDCTGAVPISSLSSVIWAANQSAQCDVGFVANDWTGHLNKTGSEANFSLAIGVWNGSLFTPHGSATGTFDGAGEASFTISAYAFDVPSGDYLALMITNTDTQNINIHTNQLNDVSSPASDPGYPVPELPTIILVSAGLLMLAGYVYVGRRSK
jgi:hypothetical protein